jgi:guanosine-3',5'-bis(diphosphate) 3'-pyrophosphohydrolase
MNNFSRYWNALTFVFSRHSDQKRISANIPYVIHPIRLTLILRSNGFSEFEHGDLMIAALCHDLIEDTKTTFEEISKKFGENVAKIVNELSKPNDKSKDEWIKSFDKVSKEAKIIKMADRIDNLMDMSSSTWTREKQIQYAQQGELILNYCGMANIMLAELLKRTIRGIIQENES